MEISQSKQDEILAAIGLSFGQNTISYKKRQFKKYVSTEYRNSERYESDKSYRMFEITLLHKRSGLRVVYTTSESYWGDSDEYKLMNMFIITSSEKRLLIVDVDFSKEVFITSDKIIPFAEVNKSTE